MLNETSDEAAVSRPCFASSPHEASSKRDWSDRRKTEQAVIDGWWDEFRDAYPHEPGLTKAKGAFCAAVLIKGATNGEKKARFQEIMAAVPRYIDDCLLRGIAYANATKWLSEERWEDEHAFRAPEQAAKATAPKPTTVSHATKAAITQKPVSAAAEAPIPALIVVTDAWEPSNDAWREAVGMIGRDEAQECLDDVRDMAADVGFESADPDAFYVQVILPLRSGPPWCMASEPGGRIDGTTTEA